MPKIKAVLRDIFFLFRDAAESWTVDSASIYAASLAYYTLFSLAPILVFSVTIAGVVFSQSAVQREIVMLIESFAGEEVAVLVQDLLVANLTSQSSNFTTPIISFIILLIGASGVFNQLRTALNKIWGIVIDRPRGLGGIWYTIRKRGFSFLLVFGMGVLLLTFVIIDTFLTTLNSILGDIFPNLPAMQPVTSFVAPVFMILFFAVIFKTLPDVHVRWSAVWWGALVTTILFLLGAWVIGSFLVRSSTGSIYGAASALIILLVWVYYSAQIVFFGAEFTKVYVMRYGNVIRPRSNAVLIHEFYNNIFADLPDGDVLSESEESQLMTDRLEIKPVQPGYVSPRRAAFQRTAAALLGLAAGLLLGFLGNRRDR